MTTAKNPENSRDGHHYNLMYPLVAQDLMMKDYHDQKHRGIETGIAVRTLMELIERSIIDGTETRKIWAQLRDGILLITGKRVQRLMMKPDIVPRGLT